MDRRGRLAAADSSAAQFPSPGNRQGIGAGLDLVMAISEDCSGGTDHARRMTKYQGLANAIGRHSTRR
jgi:hypothetical protein